MHLNVAVQEPEARVIRDEIDDHVPTSGNYDGIFSDSMTVDT